MKNVRFEWQLSATVSSPGTFLAFQCCTLANIEKLEKGLGIDSSVCNMGITPCTNAISLVPRPYLS